MMNIQKTLLVSFLIASSNAYAPSIASKYGVNRVPFFASVVAGSSSPQTAVVESVEPVASISKVEMGASRVSAPSAPAEERQATPKPASQSPKQSSPGKGSHGKRDGPFAPLVLTVKNVIGEKELNQLRAKAIGLHSDVISKFVDTAESSVGNQILKVMFSLADKNHNGTIEEEELAEALTALGFDLKPKQISGIFQRADSDANGYLDYNEWRQEAPKTLRTNLIKLAKKNGGELGFLV
jgi:hypothetical protein